MNYFLLRRLHSWVGGALGAIFLFASSYLISKSLYPDGPTLYNGTLDGFSQIPFFRLFLGVFFYIPFIFYLFFGIYLLYPIRHNATRYRFSANFFYSMRHILGIFSAIVLVCHFYRMWSHGFGVTFFSDYSVMAELVSGRWVWVYLAACWTYPTTVALNVWNLFLDHGLGPKIQYRVLVVLLIFASLIASIWSLAMINWAHAFIPLPQFWNRFLNFIQMYLL